MINPQDLANLINKWGSRLKMQKFDTSYQDGVNDCIQELSSILEKDAQEEDPFNNMSEEEMEAYFQDMEADSYLMSEHYF